MAATLTPKQRRFIEEYLLDLNGAAAARRAGYSPRTANREASRLLSNVDIQEAIAAAQTERSGVVKVEAARVLEEIATVAFSDIGDVLDFTGTDPSLKPANEIPERGRRAIAGIKVRRHVEGRGPAAREVEVIEFKLWSKDSALDKLMRHLGLYKDKEPLEVLLAALPPELGAAVRRELGRLLAARSAAESGDDADAPDRPV